MFSDHQNENLYVKNKKNAKNILESEFMESNIKFHIYTIYEYIFEWEMM